MSKTNLVIDGEASETDNEDETKGQKTLRTLVEQALSSPDNMVQSLVIEGEASESDEEAPAQPIKKPLSSTTNSSVETINTIPKSASDELLANIQQDITNTFVQIISEAQQTAVEDLSQAAEVLLNTQTTIQRLEKCLQVATGTSKSINTKLNDILSYNFIPQIYFGPPQIPNQSVEKR